MKTMFVMLGNKTLETTAYLRWNHFWMAPRTFKRLETVHSYLSDVEHSDIPVDSIQRFLQSARSLNDLSSFRKLCTWMSLVFAYMWPVESFTCCKVRARNWSLWYMLLEFIWWMSLVFAYMWSVESFTSCKVRARYWALWIKSEKFGILTLFLAWFVIWFDYFWKFRFLPKFLVPGPQK